MPLRLDREKTIAREQRRPNLDLAAVKPAMLAQARQIGLKTHAGKVKQRNSLLVRRQASDGPIRHGSNRPELAAIASAFARIRSADRLEARELARPRLQPPRLPGSWIIRRMEEHTPDVTHCSVSLPLTLAPHQSAFRRNSERRAIARRERSRQPRNHGI